MRVIGHDEAQTGIQPAELHDLLATLRLARRPSVYQPVLRAVLLLAGAVRATPFSAAVHRSLLDLPVTSGMTLLELWGTHFLSLSELMRNVRMRVLFDQQSPMPTTQIPTLGERFSVERDPLPFRGTGGLLSDVVRAYSADEYVLVADAAQVLTCPLDELFAKLTQCDGDVVLATDSMGVAAGVMLIRCGALRDVQSVGYADLKEQVLPAMKRAGARIGVMPLQSLPTMAVRNAGDYLAVVRSFHARTESSDARDVSHRFELVEKDAKVSLSAKVYDSVVLSGATIQAGARVIRSVICPGAVVRAGERVADQLVGTDRRPMI